MDFALCIEHLGLRVTSYNLDDSAHPTAILAWEGEDPQPTIAELQTVWSTVQANINLDALRAERNQRLANTDWWASSDLTMTAEQTAYRQALRDITNTYTSLDDVVWPEEPNV
jgi:hypothetical protein